jgi:hypothetical protein
MKRLLLAFGALCLLALSATGIVLVVHSQQRAGIVRRFIAAGPTDLAREQAAARREGVPLDPRQLQAPLPAADQNAAPLYDRLTRLFHDKPLRLPTSAEKGLSSTRPCPPAEIAEARRALASRPEVMALVHQAADRPRCVFAHDWSTVMLTDAPMPEYQTMRHAVRLLQTESYLLAAQGRYAEAITDQTRGFRIAAQAASGPGGLPYLVAVSCQLITLTGLQSILTLAGPDAAACRQVQQAVRAPGVPPSLRAALAAEPALMEPLVQELHKRQRLGITGVTSVLQEMSSGKSAHLTPPPVSKGPDTLDSLDDPQAASAFIDAEQAEYLAEMRRLAAVADHPGAERRTLFASAATESHPDDPQSYRRIVALLFLPSVDKMGENDLRVRARQAILLAAATALSEKAKTGAYPDTLPQEFIDPFTNKPLGYRREGQGGFVVYSAGPTGHFDGGKRGEKVPGQESVFRCPAVPMPAQ